MYTLVNLLSEAKEELMARWLARVRRDHAPDAPLSAPELADHIPQFLDQVLAALQRDEEGDPAKTHRVGPLGWEHGGQRFSKGFDLTAMVREYGALQDTVLELADEAGARVSLDAMRVLGDCINRAITEAVKHFLSIAAREDPQRAVPEEPGASP